MRFQLSAAAPAMLLAIVVVVAATLGSADAQSPAPIRYTLRFPAPHTHYVEIEAEIPNAGRGPLTLMMPVWTPGSYLVREYARHVENVTARTPEGKPLAVARVAKNRWTIATSAGQAAVLAYRVYGREMGVRTNWIERDFAILNGAPTFITLADGVKRPHDVQFELPSGWQASVSGLAPGGGPHRYRADDYDVLVDSPFILGNPVQHAFEVGGRPHVLANLNEGPEWDGPRSAADTRRIVETNLRMWGSLPYDRYAFLNAIVETGGGLEHKSSMLVMTDRWTTRTRREYVDWLSLISHEYFHAWNVKRLRPAELGPFDYEHEVYTTGLWVAEGFTDYYGDLVVRRAGLSTREEYLHALSRTISELQATPGRLVQSASAASFDTWIKQYRPDENTVNTAISYYTKGAVVGFLLDARVRQATAGAKSLDDVMKAAFARYSGPRGYTAEEFRAVASDVAGQDLRAWFATTVDSTEELDYQPALDWLGLRFRPAHAAAPDKGWLGIETKNDNGRLVVTKVRRGTPAWEAGLNVEDEILATNDVRVRADKWDERLRQYTPGDRVELLVARREQLTRITATFGTEPGDTWQLEVRPDAAPEQLARLKSWWWEQP